MKRKQLTLQKLIFRYWFFLLGTVLVLLLAYGAVILSNSRKDIMENAGVMAQHYGAELDKDITGMLEAVNSIFVNNLHYKRIRTGNPDDYEWVGATYYLGLGMQENVDSIDYMGGMFFYDGRRNSMRSIYSDYPYSGTKIELDSQLKKVLSAEEEIYRGYTFLECAEESYLVYFIKTQENYLGFLVNLSRYFSEEEKTSVFYVYQGETQQEERIVAEVGSGTISQEDIWKAMHENSSRSGRRGEILTPVRLKSMDMSLVVSSGTLNLFEIWKQPDLWLVVILIPVASFAILLILLKNLRGILLYPVEHLFLKVNEMTPGGEKRELPEKENRLQIAEFVEIDRKIDGVLEQMMQLQEEKFREKQRVKEVQLQYYQLQVDPHFFLNCLNTISTLLETHSVDAANDMIRSFSSYFRYIFRNQKQPVTVAEEIREVRAYCNIYSLKGGVPILLQTDVKEEAKDCQIPILCIQTFVENSIKHVRKNGMVLTIKIQIGIVEDEEGEHRLSICITDNGSGYPEELLEELNRPVVEFRFRSHHVGIENLKYRIYLTCGEQANWYFYNSPYGGAITEITLPERIEQPQTE